MARKTRWPPLVSSKNPSDYAAFPGGISRWIWRTFSQRLTVSGRWFFAATIMLAMYGGTSHTIFVYVLAIYASAIWLIALLAMLLFRPKVKLTSHYSTRVFAGQMLRADVTVEQLSRLTVADLVIVPHKLPPPVDAEFGDGVRLGDLSKGQSSTLRVNLHCRARGSFTLREFRVETDFPFGILRAQRIFEHKQNLIVYPKFFPLARLDLPTGRRYQPGGVALVSELGESFEYLGNREYREGDNVRDMDWRATARAQRLIVREWVEEYMLRAAVILDTFEQENEEPFERAISIAASVSDYLARQDYLVDIFAAGPNLYHLIAGRSLAYLDQILEILACVEASKVEPFEIIEPQIEELMSRLSTVICIFLDWDQTRQDFATRLRSQGVAMKIVICRDEPCAMDPASAASVFGQIQVISHADFEMGVTEL